MQEASTHQQRVSGTTADFSACAFHSPTSLLSVTDLLQIGFRSSVTQGNREQLCCVRRADRAGANGGWVGGVGGCATVRHGKAKSPLREQKENPHHCNCSAPSQPLVWPSTCTPYLTTHRSCFLILLQKEFERMYYHSWGETESRSAFLDVLFILLLGVSRAKFPLLSDPEHRSKGKKDPVFVVCIFRLPPLRTYIQQ